MTRRITIRNRQASEGITTANDIKFPKPEGKTKPQIVVDIGTTKICAASGFTANGEINVTGLGTVPALGFERGIVVDKVKAKQAIRDAMHSIRQDYSTHSIIVGINGSYIDSSFNREAVLQEDRSRVALSMADIRRIHKLVIKDLDEYPILHLLPQIYRIDDITSTKTPLGLYSSSLNLEAYLITGCPNPLENLQDCFKELGIKVQQYAWDAIYEPNVLLSWEELMEGVVLIDIGGEETDIVAFNGGRITKTLSLPIGGQQLTRDIAFITNRSFEEAEAIKLSGKINLMETDEQDCCIPDIGQIPLQDVRGVLRARIDELLEVIKSNLRESMNVRCGIILTGGTAGMPGLSEFTLEMTQLFTRTSKLKVEIDSKMDSLEPQYHSAAGLLLPMSEMTEKAILPVLDNHNRSNEKYLRRLKQTQPRIGSKNHARLVGLPFLNIKTEQEKMARTIYVQSGAKIKAIGVGGAGCNAVTRIAHRNIKGIELAAVNTDAQALALTEAPLRLQVGEKTTRGFGAGGDNKLGYQAANESREEIKNLVKSGDLIFIVAGMGGGTGTGAAAVVAEEAKQAGALTIAVVTKPFGFEGTYRAKVAKEGINQLVRKVDCLIMIPNERLFEILDTRAGIDGVFRLADDMMVDVIKALSEVMTVPGLINLDFADIRSVMKDSGLGWTSFGWGVGSNRAVDAAKMALGSPLLDVSMDGSKGVIFSIVGNSTLTLYEVNSAANLIRKAVHPNANIIFGVSVDDSIGDKVRLSIIATGFTQNAQIRVDLRYYRRILEEPSSSEPLMPARLAPTSYNINVLDWEGGYDVFRAEQNVGERTQKIKALRDDLIGRDKQDQKQDPSIDLLNALWRLSSEPSSVPDYSRAMVRFLQGLLPNYDTYAVYQYYLFISASCDVTSAHDIAVIPLKYLSDTLQSPQRILKPAEIPIHLEPLLEVIQPLSIKADLALRVSRLRVAREKLTKMADICKADIKTPENICFSYVIGKWAKTVSESIIMALNTLGCRVISKSPVYLNRSNALKIEFMGGPPGKDYKVSAPNTAIYDMELNSEAIEFIDGKATIDVKLNPHCSGILNLMFEVEDVTLQVEVIVGPWNPFVVGAPLQSDEMFVGRQHIVNRIIRGLVAQPPAQFLILGRRRIGKTSLLYAVQRNLPEQILPVFVSTEMLGKTSGEVCRSLINSISSSITRRTPGFAVPEYRPDALIQDPNNVLLTWLQALGNQLGSLSINRIVLLIDEAMGLIEWEGRTQVMLRYILSNLPWVSGLLAGPTDIVYRMKEGSLSALYNIFTTIKLGSISKEDAQKLFVPPLERHGIANTSSIFDVVYRYSGGIPYYIQAVGSEIIECHVEKQFNDVEHLTKCLEQAKESLRASYPVTLRLLTPAQKITIVSVASGLGSSEVVAKQLVESDLVNEVDGKYVVVPGIERDWIREYSDQLLDSAGQALWSAHANAIDLNRLADELTEISRSGKCSSEIKQSIDKAIQAAKNGDGAKAYKYLGKVGTWAIEAATKIGTEVAATAIKHTMGIL